MSVDMIGVACDLQIYLPCSLTDSLIGGLSAGHDVC